MIVLANISTKPPTELTRDSVKKERADLLDELEKLQNLLVAESKHSLLIVLQGMDASGKDGLVRKVFREVSPAGVRVHSFKKPTDLEFAHDFLWRAHQVAPQKGMIQVFNRSHYEDILIQRVHNWIDTDRVKQRIKHINNFEQLLLEENCLNECSPQIPWHIIPADENWYKEYNVLKIIVETLRSLNMQFPAIEPKV